MYVIPDSRRIIPIPTFMHIRSPIKSHTAMLSCPLIMLISRGNGIPVDIPESCAL